MHVFLGLLVGVIGSLSFGVSGLILGGLVGVLAAEVLELRKRISFLEKSGVALRTEQERKAEAPEEEVVFAPPPDEPPPARKVGPPQP